LSFVERHGLWSAEQKDAAVRLRRVVEEQKLEVIRLSFRISTASCAARL
jgi:glutamine synthetase